MNTKVTATPKRKTYTVSIVSAHSLAKRSLQMSEQLGVTVSRQDILDAGVQLLDDAAVYKKAFNHIKNKKGL